MSNELIRPLRGMKDLLGKEFKLHNHIIDMARKISFLYCYEGISTPILEYAYIFNRTLGKNSDILTKEMYSFLDRRGLAVALRPEFTAGVMRAFLSNGLQQKLPLKLFSYGPLFRYDRPQRGRYRQFHQVNYEHLGSNDPYSDAEIIKLATHLFQELNILDEVRLEINSLGCENSRILYQEALTKYYGKYENELSNESKLRLKKNPLRILDSKDANDKKITAEAPLIADFYTSESKVYFEKVLSYLNIFNIKYKVSPRLVRGLDYYCHTAFEFLTSKLAHQNALGGGGRYDSLCKSLKGKHIPAVGLGIGIERLALIMVLKNYSTQNVPPLCLIPVNQECEKYIIELAELLRSNSVPIVIELKGKIQKRLKKALQDGINYVVFAGLDEIKNNTFKLKALEKRDEREVSAQELLDFAKILYP